MSLRILQLHKRASGEYTNIRDKYAVSFNGSIVALADGTTQSFQGGVWAEMLVRSFSAHTKSTIEEILTSFKKAAIDFEELPYAFNPIPALALLEKAKMAQGATSTFLAIIIGNGEAKIINCGDSNLFLLNKDGELRSVLFQDIDHLDSNNSFLNTKALLDDKINKDHFQIIDLDVSGNDILILATDALSRLLLSQPQKIDDILRIRDFNGLHQFCLENWDNRQLQEDDISAIIVETFDHPSPPVIIVPSVDFQFPKPVEQEFEPFISSTKELIFTDMQFNDIMRQFSFIENDFRKMKTRMNLQGILTLIVVLLLLALLFFSRAAGSGVGNEKELKQQLKTKQSQIEQLEKEIENLKKGPPASKSSLPVEKKAGAEKKVEAAAGKNVKPVKPEEKKNEPKDANKDKKSPTVIVDEKKAKTNKDTAQ